MDFGALKRSIRFKLLGGILILELLMVAVFSGVFLHSTRKDMALNAAKAVERSQGAYNLILQGDSKMLSAAMDCFATNAAVRQVYAEHQDRQKLLDAVQDVYRQNKTRYGITHLYFIDKDGACFLRAHDPSIFGDQIQRDTFLQARAAGKTFSGIELGKTAFALRVVTPYLHAGNLIGFLEFGEEIDHFDQLVKRETGVDVAVMVDKRFLDEDQYRKTMKAARKADTWNQFKGFVMVSTTLPDAKAASSLVSEEDFRATATPEYFGTLDRNGASFAKGAFPLKDSSGKQVGVVLTLNDVTSQVNNERMALWALVLIALLVFAGSFALAAAYLRTEIVGPLVQLADQARDISMGNVDLKMETNREDEIGLLIRAFERMRVSLKKSMAMLTRGD